MSQSKMKTIIGKTTVKGSILMELELLEASVPSTLSKKDARPDRNVDIPARK